MIHSERLSAFVAFGNALSFTKAARSLHISQPALHVQIQRLAEELGVTLYRRQGRGLVLTEDGQRLLAFAREAVARDEEFRAELRGETRSGPLVLAAGQGALLYLLGPALKALGKAHGRRFRVLSRDATQTVAAVRSGEATVGVAVTG